MLRPKVRAELQQTEHTKTGEKLIVIFATNNPCFITVYGSDVVLAVCSAVRRYPNDMSICRIS